MATWNVLNNGIVGNKTIDWVNHMGKVANSAPKRPKIRRVTNVAKSGELATWLLGGQKWKGHSKRQPFSGRSQKRHL